MIDYQSILKQLQGQTEQEQQPSLFPAGPLGNLSSILRFIGTTKAAPLADKQKQFLSQLTQASSLGISSLRKLYADPQFQQTAKELNAQLPPLSEESPQEIQEARTRGFYGKVAESQKIGAGFEDKTLSEQRRKALGLAEQQFPEVAQREGFTQKLPAGVITQMLKSIGDYRTDPSQVLAQIRLAVTMTGGDPALIQELENNLKYQIGPYSQLQMDTLKATYQSKIANAQLNDVKRTAMLKTLDLNVAKLKAEIDDLQSKGRYTDALESLTRWKEESGKLYEPLKEQLAQSQIQKNLAWIPYYQAHTDLANAQTAYTNARTTHEYNIINGVPLKGQEQSAKDEATAALKHLNMLYAQRDLHPGDAEVLNPKIEEAEKNYNEAIGTLNDIRKQINTGQTRPTPKKEPLSGDPDKIVLSNTNAVQLFNMITASGNQIPMQNWIKTYDAYKNSNAAKLLSSDDWNTLKNKLILQAWKNSKGQIDLR